ILGLRASHLFDRYVLPAWRGGALRWQTGGPPGGTHGQGSAGEVLTGLLQAQGVVSQSRTSEGGHRGPQSGDSLGAHQAVIVQENPRGTRSTTGGRRRPRRRSPGFIVYTCGEVSSQGKRE